MNRSRLARQLVATALFVGCVAVSCGRTEPTELVAGITTQMQVPKDIKTIAVLVKAPGVLPICEVYGVVDGTVRLPSTLGFQPNEDDETPDDGPITITVIGLKNSDSAQVATDCDVGVLPNAGLDKSKTRIVRRRRVPYAPNRIVYLPMPLKESCDGVKCGADSVTDESNLETCLGGKCVSPDIDSGTLVDYQDRLAFGNTNTCFSVSLCLPKAATIPATLVEPDTCTFQITLPDDVPAPAPGDVNVRVVYDSYGTEVLDLDPDEGFVLPDPQQPLRFRLASNLCDFVYKTGRILAVSASPLCPAKTLLQPICDGDLAEIQGGNPETKDKCQLGESLQPTESALYVLMDRSKSMGKFFGEEGLQKALETPLGNPIAARTKLGFKFLPAGAASCTGSSPYATPTDPEDVPFGLVENVRTDIAAKIGDIGNVNASDDPLFLDAAMRPEAAYQALRDLQPQRVSRFNRRALLILGNRDLWSHCNPVDGVPTPQELAAAALGNAVPVYTYAVVLPAPADADQFGRDPVVDAEAIAAAGGTEATDATTEEGAGALALQSIVNDLGSCLYDLPPELEDPMVHAAVKLSYLDPTTLTTRIIDHDESCTETASGANGWAVEGGEFVRICGSACNRLRDDLTAAAIVAAQENQSAPNIPIRMQGACSEE